MSSRHFHRDKKWLSRMIETVGSGYSASPVRKKFYDVAYFSCSSDMKIVCSDKTLISLSLRVNSHSKSPPPKSIYFAKKNGASMDVMPLL